jgi:hypothetical protein
MTSRSAGRGIKAGYWAAAFVMTGLFMVACNEETLPRRSPAAEETSLIESPYSTPRTNDPVAPDDPPAIAGTSGAPGPRSNTESDVDDTSPDVGVVEEEDVAVPTVSAPEPTTDSNLGAAGGDPCGIPGGDCTIIDNDNGSEGAGQIAENSPGVLTTPEVGNVENGGASRRDSRDENGGSPTTDTDTPTPSPPPD